MKMQQDISHLDNLDDSINSVKIGGVEPKEENVYNDKYLVLF